MDDFCGWEDSIKDSFLHTCEYLSLTASHGIIQTPAKFQFCQKELEFVGFWFGSSSVQPSEETLEAIKNFPKPTNITGICSFFGLIEQVAWAFSEKTVMLPFKPLLSKSASFAWSAELQHAFESAREAIVQAVKDGVKTFSPNAVTCLSTVWSNIGLGAVLWQKHCSCAGASLTCCNGGWLICGVQSRYCNPAESNYAPI